MMINNMLYWTAKQTEKLNDAQIVVASGKQINKPSDNPTIAGEIIKDRVTIATHDQYQSNIEQADTWIEISNTILDSVNTLLRDAQDIMSSSLSSGDETTSGDYAVQLQNIYEQIISLANSQDDSNYMYSGNQSSTAPFSNTVVVSGSASTDIVYDLAGVASDLTIEIVDSTGTVVRTITSSAGIAGTNTLTWDGCDDSGNALADGVYSFTVSATNGIDAVAAYPSYRGDEGGKKFIVGDKSIATLDNNGGCLFSDILSVLSQGIVALENNVDLASDLTINLEEAKDKITSEQVTLSNIKSQLDTSNNRLAQLTSYINGRISDLETGSTTEAATKLEEQNTNYEVTLQTVASILKMPNLTDYLS
jgi:flagellar hook-associated protein 3 FlgL